jgi:hypothetical protein
VVLVLFLIDFWISSLLSDRTDLKSVPFVRCKNEIQCFGQFFGSFIGSIDLLTDDFIDSMVLNFVFMVSIVFVGFIFGFHFLAESFRFNGCLFFWPEKSRFWRMLQ